MADAGDFHNRELALRLYRTHGHPCAYLPGRTARSLFVDPELGKDAQIYSTLQDMGFRRSGSEIYRPDCAECDRCIAARLPVVGFRPRRSQRRTLKANADLQIRPRLARYSDECFELYFRYIQHRHGDGEMANPTPEDFVRFLVSDWCETLFIELRRQGRLVGVAVTDVLPRGLSAVYTFFDPEREKHSPGVFSILTQIAQARRLGLPWLYLGYWVHGCRKMEYKTEYRPLQLLVNGHWKGFEREDPLPGGERGAEDRAVGARARL